MEPLILVVEDDPALVDTLRRILTTNGYRLVVAGSVAEARALLEQVEPQLILLDIVLPDGDGLILASALKRQRSTPMIIVSARSRQVDRVLGLKLGADDFVSKPFDVDELLARMAAVLRRSKPTSKTSAESPDQLIFGALRIVRSRVEVLVGAVAVRLTPTEYRLLNAMADRAGAVLTREHLLSAVWGYDDASAGAGHLIDVHLGRLRQKLERAGLRTPRILTVRGRGFQFVFEPEPSPET